MILITIKDIALKAGVSTAAVSRYFNNGYVSEDKRKAIKKVVDETGFLPSQHARTLRTRKTGLIGVILPRISSNSISKMVSGILKVTDREEYKILLANTLNEPERELEYLKIFNEKQVDGVILFGTILTDKHSEFISQMKIPIVVVGQNIKGVNSVYHDEYHVTYDLTKLLLSKGCKNMAYIGVTFKDKAVGLERYKGYRDALKDEGLEEFSKRKQLSGFDMMDGYNSMKKIIKNYPDVDGVVAATDTIGVGAIKYLEENNYDIPNQIMITGVGNSNLGNVTSPSLTTARYYFEESGVKAAEIIIKHIRNQKSAIEQVMIGYEILEKGSTVKS
ncbi:MAG: LacI family DNA-binding transcriptional regulator [Lachnospiraceae bacterium]|nr:LacI family DNA-binding transcriptional regulator [Lachnospiraceae bacterium]